MQFFYIFAIKPQFNPDIVNLKKQFLLLSRQYHPDFFANEIETVKDAMEEKASQLNIAYKTLTNSEATLQYILEQYRVLQEGQANSLPQSFLMEVMDLNERLMEGDEALIQQAVASLKASIYAPVSDIIEKNDASALTKPELKLLTEYYLKKKYLDRILERMD